MNSSPNGKKIENRWLVTRWNFDPVTKELVSTDTSRTKPMTEKEIRTLITTKMIAPNMCWFLKKGYK